MHVSISSGTREVHSRSLNVPTQKCSKHTRMRQWRISLQLHISNRHMLVWIKSQKQFAFANARRPHSSTDIAKTAMTYGSEEYNLSNETAVIGLRSTQVGIGYWSRFQHARAGAGDRNLAERSASQRAALYHRKLRPWFKPKFLFRWKLKEENKRNFLFRF